MYADVSSVKLGDVVNRRFIGELLSVFSKSIGLATVCVDVDSNFTNEIGYTDYYKKLMLKSPECARESLLQRIRSGEKAVEIGEPYVYESLCGLTNFAVPLLIDNKHYGSIVCGQILTEPPSKEKFTAILNKYGLKYEDFEEEISKVKVISQEKLSVISNYMHEVATTFSSVYAINSQRERQEKLLLTLLRATDINYDIEDIVNLALKTVTEILGVERAMVISFKDENPKIEYDYRTSNDIKRASDLCSQEAMSKIVDYWKSILYQSGGEVHFNDINELKIDDRIKQLYAKVGLKSAMAYLMRTETELRIVILAKYFEKHIWTKQQNLFLKLVSEQLSIAMNQYKLKSRIKKLKALQTSLIKDLPFPAFIKDKNGTYIEANKLFLKLKSTKDNSIVGFTDDEIWASEEISNFCKRYDKQVMELHEPVNVETKFIYGGQAYSDTIYLAPVFSDSQKNEIIAIYGIVIERKI